MSRRLTRRTLGSVVTPERLSLLVVVVAAAIAYFVALALATGSSGPSSARPAGGDASGERSSIPAAGSRHRDVLARDSATPKAAPLRAVAPLPDLRRDWRRRPPRRTAAVAGPAVVVASPVAPAVTPTPTAVPSPARVVPQPTAPPPARTPQPTFDSSGTTTFDSSG
jgi:hypothetical protein